MSSADGFRVFAYGSLMWRPGFPYLEVTPAVLDGFHRAFCVYSHHYRGTPQKPGLVLGLAPGGSCRGLAFRIADEMVERVTAYLHERELVSYAYKSRHVPVMLPEGRVTAYTFVADPDHPQYAGDLGPERSAEIIMKAAGAAGLNRDYLIQTVRQLERSGHPDPALHALLERVWRLTGEIDAGGGI
ncbi:MAG: gamma-glutamylcyclotransferase [Rhodospirillales bacterium]|nr:MAG: gamma-glutamylcyclotransferase [Rhodospirillales bacterium]